MFKFNRKPSAKVEVAEVQSSAETVLEAGGQTPTIKTSRKDSARLAALETGVPLHRYWFRGGLGLFVPIATTTYWFLVWYIYLVPTNADDTVNFGHNGGRWVYYSWFLIGVFGLNLSNYALCGLEAGMLMDKRWAAKNAMHLMVHAEHTWGGPSGWLRVLKSMFARGKNRPQGPTPLWVVLAILTILPFAALPLTGLSYELKSGFHSTFTHPSVIGIKWDNINSRSGAGIGTGTWMNGANATIPGLSVIYTPSGLDRSKISYLSSLPNSLPVDEGLREAFITAQAHVPISGRSWGLALQYDCSIVDKLSDFTILNHRNASALDDYYPTDDMKTAIYIYNSTYEDLYADNYEAFMEEGYQFPPTAGTDDLIDDSCYYWNHDDGGEYPGLRNETVYEALLWQYLDESMVSDGAVYNSTIDSNITELYGTRKVYIDWNPRNNGEPYTRDMTAIGIRCTASSAVGEAKIDGRSSSFTDFQRTDTPISFLDTCASRVETVAPAGIINLGEEMTTEYFPWNLFRSSNSPVLFAANYTIGSDHENKNKTIQPVQLSYLQATDLKRSLLRTYAAYTSELMFNGGVGYSTAEGIQNISYINENATAFEVKKIFESGDIQFWIPGGLFLVWAVGCVTLQLMYGFRRRWSATLDGYSMFRFGADYAEQIRDRPEFGVNMGFEDCSPLREIPGLIGDAQSDSTPGHITLVPDNAAAAKGKLYM